MICYLVIDNLEGYFDFCHNTGYLNMSSVNSGQHDKYYQVWKEIIKLIIGDYVELKSCK